MSITLRFISGKSFVSQTIRRFEYEFWASHVEAVLPDGKHVISADMALGVAVLPIDYNDGSYDRAQYVTIQATPEQSAKFYAFLHAQVGKPYDDKAVVGIALGRNWLSPDHWFCSELDAGGLCDCGIFPQHLAVDLNHVTPRDLLLIISGRDDVSVSDKAPTPEPQLAF
jgi:hypothetical protein